MGSGNGRQYKQTVSLGEFRKRLYRRLGATACNLTSLDLQLNRPCIGARDANTIIGIHTVAHSKRDLPLSFFQPGSQKLRYTGGAAVAAVFIRRVSHPVIVPLASLVIDVFARALPARMNLRPRITAKFFREKVDSRNARIDSLKFYGDKRFFFSLSLFEKR